jgi:hypothetical protein
MAKRKPTTRVAPVAPAASPHYVPAPYSQPIRLQRLTGGRVDDLLDLDDVYGRLPGRALLPSVTAWRGVGARRISSNAALTRPSQGKTSITLPTAT